ncbi:MAG: ECF transporter S component [Eubacteriales bacterium]|nr:ECF transporter S component [Eubacteriales bacterium]MDD3199661.1 ECF transporter S component [Eubacteriales bacterium]MDD4121356.1 ECF transporter S component [Eubacteriales bacterium]MDD4629802.1 ECF transporter S component [Eubacteriales bacterium]
MNRSERTIKITKTAMLAAISLVLILLIRIPFPPAPFLVYDPADIPILIGAFAFGPLTGIILTVIVSFIQAFMLGGDGIIGFFMHVVATGSFVLVAGHIYKHKKTRKNAVIALICGTIVMTVSMLLWNLLVTPFFLGVPREAVMAMLATVILPFNLLKAGLNAFVTFLTYKSISKFLHK